MFAGESLHISRGLWVLLVLALLGGVVAGCTSFFNKTLVNPDELSHKLNSGTPANTVQPLSAGFNSCVSPIMEPERSQLLEQALADAQLQAVRTQLENRGLQMNSELAIAQKVGDGQQLLIPFGDQAHLVWQSHQGQTLAFGLIQQGDQTLNISSTGQERTVRELTADQAKKLLKKLRGKNKFKEFEKQLKDKGKRLADERIHILLDETRGVAAIGLATADSAGGNFTHQLRVALKKTKDDELEDGADPTVQETACSQVSAQAKLPQTAASNFQVRPTLLGDGDPPVGGGSGSICTSSWGYEYLCTSTTPQFGLTGPSSQLIAFVNTSAQTTFTVWNYGGGTLTGTATAGAPFSIVAGGSYSLTPGKPQTITVQFSPTASGSFSGTLQLVAGSLVNDVAFSASTLTISPASLNFAALVGGTQDQTVTVKNDAPASQTITDPNAVTVTVSTSAPYSVVGSSSLGIRGQSSGQWTIRFAPTAVGSFAGSVHLAGPSNTDLPLAGSTYQVSLNPAQPSLTAFVNSTGQQNLTVSNTGTAGMTVTASTAVPFSIVSPTTAFSLAPNASQVVTVKFSPTTAGTSSGNLHLAVGTGSKDFSLSGTAYQMSVNPAPASFPGVFVGGFAQRTVTVTNTGTVSIAVTPSTSAPFSIVSPTAAVTLAPSASQDIIVKVSPTAAGSFSGNLHLATSGALAQEVALSGWTLTVNQAILDFTSFVGKEPTTCTGGLGGQTVPCEADRHQDQVFTVKSDGPNNGTTPAVTVGLSASAPYSIVGASSMSLNAQQSFQFTVRFTPTDSGVFSGNIALSATSGGITSSSNVGAKGTAHKITIDPSQPYFISFTDISPEAIQKLTIKNTGVTTVSLVVATNPPFSIVSPTDVFTMAPDQSQKVTVRFSPTSNGDFQVPLTFNVPNQTSGPQITAQGHAVTWAEYIQAVLDSYNAAAQQGLNGMLIARNPNRRTNLGLLGFPEINPDDLDAFWDYTENKDNFLNNFQMDPATKAKIQQATQMLDALDADTVFDWINQLVDAAKQGTFDQKYDQLLATGMIQLQDILTGPIGLSTADARQRILDMATHIAQLPLVDASQTPVDPATWKKIEDLVKKLQGELYVRFLFVQIADLGGALAQLASFAGASVTSPFDVVNLVVNRFETALRVAAGLTDSNGQRVFSDEDLLNFAVALEHLINQGVIHPVCRVGQLDLCSIATGEVIVELFRLGDFAKLFDWMSNPSGPRTVRDKIEQGMGTVFVADNLVKAGWWYGGLSLCSNSRCHLDYTQQYGDWWAADLMGVTRDTGTLVSLVVRGDHCLQCGTQAKAIEIFYWVQEAINMGNGVATYIAGTTVAVQGVINVVFTNGGAHGVTTVVDLLKAFFNGKDVLIIVSWKDKNGHVYYTCIGKQCQNLSPQDQQQIACNDQGQAANCNPTQYIGQHFELDVYPESDAVDISPIPNISPNPRFTF